MHFQLGERSVHLLEVVRSQNEFGKSDTFPKMLDLSCAWDQNDEELLGQQPSERVFHHLERVYVPRTLICSDARLWIGLVGPRSSSRTARCVLPIAVVSRRIEIVPFEVSCAATPASGNAVTDRTLAGLKTLFYSSNSSPEIQDSSISSRDRFFVSRTKVHTNQTSIAQKKE